MGMANGICAMLNKQTGSYFGYLAGRSQKGDFFFGFNTSMWTEHLTINHDAWPWYVTLGY